MVAVLDGERLDEEHGLGDLILPKQVEDTLRFELNSGRPFRNTIALAGTGGTGKAQPLDSLVLTPSGWREMGSLRVGDVLVDPFSDVPSKVQGVFPQGERDIYELTFSDGSSCEATLDHLWMARDNLDPWNGWFVWSTREIREKMTEGTVFIPLMFSCNRPLWGNCIDPTTVKYVTSIRFTRIAKAQCIKVSAPTSTYVTDDFTVTHNTALGFAIAKQLRSTNVVLVSNRPDKSELKTIYDSIEEGSMLIADEIHAYAKQSWLLDLLYGARGLAEKVYFTAYGATTNRGALPQTVMGRFPVKLYMKYSLQEEMAIAEKVAERFGVALSPEERRTLLNAAVGNPRCMETVLGFWACGDPAEAVRLAGLSPDGLDQDALAMLTYLGDRRRPIGRATLAKALEAPGGLDDIESVLVRRKYIAPNERGLEITTDGKKRLRILREENW
jgi:Holliday junction resolvasome RuvABC ATP-dependent DNA helicase subunit